MSYQVEEWRRKARESQAWADRARPAAVKYRSDRRWFWAIAAICGLLAVTGTLMVLAPLAHGKQTRWGIATASVYDGIGLGGRVALEAEAA